MKEKFLLQIKSKTNFYKKVDSFLGQCTNTPTASDGKSYGKKHLEKVNRCLILVEWFYVESQDLVFDLIEIDAIMLIDSSHKGPDKSLSEYWFTNWNY